VAACNRIPPGAGVSGSSENAVAVQRGLDFYTEGEFAKAIEQWRPLANEGFAKAQRDMGLAYESGNGVGQDYAQAVAWYRKAADQGDAEGQLNLGYMYDDGQGVPQDYAQAVAWYRKAADQGNADAQNSLGAMYDDGRGVAKDEVQATVWYRKAADQGDPVAQYNLGDSYRDGQGVPRDYTQAAAWYRKAADQGDVDAKTALNNLINPEPVAPAPVDVVMFDIGNGLRFLRGESLDDFKALHPTFVCEADASPPDCTPAAEKPAVADCPSSDACTAIEYTFDKEKKMDGFTVTYAKSSVYKKLLAVSTKQFGRPTHHLEQLYGAPAISERWVFKRSADVMVRFTHLSGNYGSYGFNQPIEEAYSISYTSDGFQDD
jgi:hypothetical protein